MPTNELISALLCVTLPPDRRTHKCDEACPYYVPDNFVSSDGTIISDGWCDLDQINKDAVAHIMELTAFLEEVKNEKEYWKEYANLLLEQMENEQ